MEERKDWGREGGREAKTEDNSKIRVDTTFFSSLMWLELWGTLKFRL